MLFCILLVLSSPVASHIAHKHSRSQSLLNMLFHTLCATNGYACHITRHWFRRTFKPRHTLTQLAHAHHKHPRQAVTNKQCSTFSATRKQRGVPDFLDFLSDTLPERVRVQEVRGDNALGALDARPGGRIMLSNLVSYTQNVTAFRGIA